MSNTPYPPTLRVGILVYEGFEPLDVWGFTEAFTISRFIGTNYEYLKPCPFEVFFISTETRNQHGIVPAPISSWNGPRVAPDYFLDEALEQQVDVLMIPGGNGTGNLLNAPNTPDFLHWVKQMDTRVQVMTSVCTGAAVLAAAGLLNGKPAATNHQTFGWVASFGPKVLWDNVARWVDAGHYVTSAGVSAGTDMGFYLVKRLAGRAVAETAVLHAEYNWQQDPNKPIHYTQGAVVPGAPTPQ
jgi:putative intracellular protease/amidase